MSFKKAPNSPRTSKILIALVLIILCSSSVTASELDPETSVQFITSNLTHVGGKWSVAQGIGVYEIPLKIPSGVGHSPSLSIIYHSKSPSTTLGHRFGLSGLSMIHRCSKRIDLDGEKSGISFDPTDVFCFDSVRLIMVQQGTYKTEYETWTRITSTTDLTNHLVNMFTVTSKRGHVSTYLPTADFQFYLITKQTDLFGNTINYIYHNNTRWIERIEYGSNEVMGTEHSRSVKFQYDWVGDYPRYIHGTEHSTPYLLRRIQSYIDGKMSTNYLLNYQNGQNKQTLLNNITQFSTDDVAIYSNFHWKSVDQDQEKMEWSSIPTGLTLTSNCYNKRLVECDYDLDGRMDFIKVCDTNRNSLEIYLARDDGTYATTPIEIRLEDTIENLSNLQAADVNGDGNMDLIIPDLRNRKIHLSLLQNGVFGTFESFDIDSSIQNYCSLLSIDVNGDSRSDLIFYDAANGVIYTYLWNGLSFILQAPLKTTESFDSLIPMDFNGDGRVDLIQIIRRPTIKVTVYTSNSTLSIGSFQTLFPQATDLSFDETTQFISIDMNADGNSDLIILQADPNSGNLQLFSFVSTGISFLPQQTLTTTLKNTNLVNFVAADVNGDNKKDLVLMYAGDVVQIYTWISHGSNFEEIGPQTLQNVDPGTTTLLLDYLGNSKSHLLLYDDSKSTITLISSLFESNQDIVSIENPYSYSINMTYDYLPHVQRDPSDLKVTYPLQKRKGATKVVKSYFSSNSTDQIKYKYSYSDVLCYDSIKDNLVGFASTSIYEESTGLAVDHHHDLEMNGKMINLTQWHRPSSKLLSTELLKYSLIEDDNKVKTTRLSSHELIHYDENSEIMSNLTSTFTYELCNVAQKHVYNDGILNTYSHFSYKLDFDRNILVHQNESILYDSSDEILSRSQVEYDNKFAKSQFRVMQNETSWLTKKYQYNDCGKHTGTTSYGGHQYVYVYSSDCFHKIAEIFPQANGVVLFTNITWDPVHDVVKSTRWQDGRITTNILDGFGRVVATSLEFGQISVMVSYVMSESDGDAVYYEVFQRQDWTKEQWLSTKKYLDSYGRKIKTLSSDGKIREMWHDSLGNLMKSSVIRFQSDPPHYFHFDYDYQNRLQKKISPNGTYDSYVYMGMREIHYMDVIPGNEAQNHTFIYDYKFIGSKKVVSGVTQPDGAKLSYYYTPNAQLSQVDLLVNGKTITLQKIKYNMLGKVIQAESYDADTVFYEYSPTTSLLVTKKVSEFQVNYKYDEMNRVSIKEYQQNDVSQKYSYSYDRTPSSLGKLSGVASGINSISYEYDKRLGSVNQKNIRVENTQYVEKIDRHPTGQVNTLQYPENSLVEVVRFEANGLPECIKFNQSPLANLNSYDAVGNDQKVEYLNNVIETQKFDPIFFKREKLSVVSHGNVIINDTISLDPFFNVKKVIQRRDGQDVATEFNYTISSGLLSALGQFTNEEYQYDDLGNMIYKNGVNFTYDQFKPVSGIENGEKVFNATYHNGKMTSRIVYGNVWNYTYLFDKLHTVSLNGSLIVTFEYFGGRRISRKSASDCTIYPFGNYYERCNQTEKNLLIHYSDRMIHVQNDQIFTLHKNFANNIVAITNSKGELIEPVVWYDSYGKSPVSKSKYKYMGMEYDPDLDLYFFKSRFYDVFTGRFISADSTLGYSRYITESYNKFALSLNNPISFSDNGHSIWDSIGAIIVSALELIGGIALTVLTDGTAAQIGGGLIGAGISGIQYSAENFNDFSWKNWGIQEGIGFATSIGMPEGGAAVEAEAGESAESSVMSDGIEMTEMDSAAEEDSMGGMCSLDCLGASTLIHTSIGQKRVSELVSTDQIISLDHNRKLTTASIEFIHSRSQKLYSLHFGDSKDVIQSTGTHKFFVVGKGWITLDKIMMGDTFITYLGKSLLLVDIQTVGFEKTYEIGLKDHHTFFVGVDGILVHNPHCVAGSHKQEYEEMTNAAGEKSYRLTEVKYKLEGGAADKGSAPNDAATTYAQSAGGGVKWQSGHALPNADGGWAKTSKAGVPDNAFPQNPTINMGVNAQFEKAIRGYVAKDPANWVEVVHTYDYTGLDHSIRPKSYTTSFKTNNAGIQGDVLFPNDPKTVTWREKWRTKGLNMWKAVNKKFFDMLS